MQFYCKEENKLRNAFFDKKRLIDGKRVELYEVLNLHL